MSSIERYGGPSNMRGRDARAVERRTSSAVARATGTIAEVDAVGDVWQEILTENDRLTGAAMRGVLQIGQAEEIGSQMVPGAAHRLSHLADGHAMSGDQILAAARRDLGRLTR